MVDHEEAFQEWRAENDRRRSETLVRYFGWGVVLASLFFGLYEVKCALGVDLIPGWHLWGG